MLDVSTYDINTPVLIRMMRPVGVEIPELHSRIPIESYASIAQIISIMNRGLDIDFPKESEEHEISKKIEDIMIEYKAKSELAQEKGYLVENTIETALDTIQNKNNTSLTEKEAEEEFSRHIFTYQDILERIYNNLHGSELDHIFETDDYKKGVDRIQEAKIQRIARERLNKFKKEYLNQKTYYDKASIDFFKYKIGFEEPFYTDNADIEFKLD